MASSEYWQCVLWNVLNILSLYVSLTLVCLSDLMSLISCLSDNATTSTHVLILLSYNNCSCTCCLYSFYMYMYEHALLGWDTSCIIQCVLMLAVLLEHVLFLSLSLTHSLTLSLSFSFSLSASFVAIFLYYPMFWHVQCTTYNRNCYHTRARTHACMHAVFFVLLNM